MHSLQIQLYATLGILKKKKMRVGKEGCEPKVWESEKMMKQKLKRGG